MSAINDSYDSSVSSATTEAQRTKLSFGCAKTKQKAEAAHPVQPPTVRSKAEFGFQITKET